MCVCVCVSVQFCCQSLSWVLSCLMTWGNKPLHSLAVRAWIFWYLLPHSRRVKVCVRGTWGHPQCWWVFQMQFVWKNKRVWWREESLGWSSQLFSLCTAGCFEICYCAVSILVMQLLRNLSTGLGAQEMDFAQPLQERRSWSFLAIKLVFLTGEHCGILWPLQYFQQSVDTPDLLKSTIVSSVLFSSPFAVVPRLCTLIRHYCR